MKPQICVLIEPPNLCKLAFSCTSKGVRFNCREQTSVYTYKYLWCMYLQLLFWLHQGLYKHLWLPSGGGYAVLSSLTCRETRSLPLLCCTIDVPSISMQGQDNNILFWKTCIRGLPIFKWRWLLKHIQLRSMLSHIGCVNRRQHLFYIRSKLWRERKFMT